MTQQYEQYNINGEPVQPRSITSTLAVPTGNAVADDGLILIDTTASVYTLTMPSAASSPGRSITVVQSAAVPNLLTIAFQAGDAVVGAFVNPILAVVGNNVTLTSDGGTGWVVTGQQP